MYLSCLTWSGSLRWCSLVLGEERCMHIYIFIYIYLCIYVYTYIYIYIHVDMCIHMYLCILFSHLERPVALGSEPRIRILWEERYIYSFVCLCVWPVSLHTHIHDMYLCIYVYILCLYLKRPVAFGRESCGLVLWEERYIYNIPIHTYIYMICIYVQIVTLLGAVCCAGQRAMRPRSLGRARAARRPGSLGSLIWRWAPTW